MGGNLLFPYVKMKIKLFLKDLAKPRMIPNRKRCYSGSRPPQPKRVNEPPAAAAPAALNLLGREIHVSATSPAQAHHGGRS